MTATFSATRFVQLLRDQVMFLGVISKRARRAIKFGTAPLAYANSTPSTDSTADHIEEILNKSRINEQIPVFMVLMFGIHYWRGIREALEKIGAKVVIAKVPGTGGIRERAQQLDTLLDSRLASEQVNIVGHSMGGLDARYLITHINSKTYSVASLTTVCTPHRGSPFMDWCRDYLSLGYRIDPDQLIRDFAMIWKPSTAENAMRTTSTPTLSDAMLQERINSIINHAIGNRNASGVDPADSRLQEFAQFLTRLLGENASVGETSQLAHMARKSAKELDYLGRSMELLKMVYRRVMATLDTPAYACLTTDYCQQFFNPSTPDAPGVEYLSIGAHMDPADISDKVNPLIIPHDIIYKSEGPNDGFVSLRSAQWGHYLGSVCADHFDFTNRWRLTSLGRDFIGTMAYWSSKWSSWLNHKDGQSDNSSKPPAGASDAEAFKEQVNFNKSRSRFDPIEFYLRLSTILYQRGF
ncbi:hypothetical protein IWW36_002786 [Coemansia brasiliensis]|uniref:GPI inositol-deacylase n=1 Tax=Coemansia brasiliensis TaxID=2650707 RepID=A0A9W8LZK3_9FUNG|nr:hypothetical protein IWW36_002786 [Coemansia brasiliensis]